MLLPHCFDEITPEDDALHKGDLVVACASLSEGVWKIVPQSDYELVPAAEGGRGLLPSVRVRLSEEAVVGVFEHTLWPLAQRVLCLTFVPELIVPLEPDVMRVRMVADLPGAVAAAIYAETQDRGLCVVCGCSKPIRVVTDESYFTITVKRKGTPKGEGAAPAFEKRLLETQTLWDGSPQAFEVCPSTPRSNPNPNPYL